MDRARFPFGFPDEGSSAALLEWPPDLASLQSLSPQLEQRCLEDAVTCETVWANRRLPTDSFRLSVSGLSAHTSRLFPSPVKHSWRRKVSFESRKGTCRPPVTSADMVFPSALSDLLMAWASLRRSPVASVLEMRSEPARSMRLSRADTAVSPAAAALGVPTQVMVRMECDREECSFMSWLPTARFSAPRSIIASTSSVPATGTTVKPGMMFPPGDCRMSRSCFFAFLSRFSTSRSCTHSLYTSR
mmetsp:Transcript_38894/g.86960  ORF Transcript_38894/g.86960 Transcript_38894/m.86960 type:complete len:245 (-) Transcript_38894:850-1584(-)